MESLRDGSDIFVHVRCRTNCPILTFKIPEFSVGSRFGPSRATSAGWG
jgi:hypothetical protein